MRYSALDEDAYMRAAASGYTIQTPPPPVGGWRVGGGERGIMLMQTQRPRWLTRWLCWHLLEWKWIDQPLSEKTP